MSIFLKVKSEKAGFGILAKLLKKPFANHQIRKTFSLFHF
jgi:hypothetical protein